MTGSDFAHWGEGDVCITAEKIIFQGRLAIGPDYYLYYTPNFVESGGDFDKSKSFKSERITNFNGFGKNVEI